ncbi:hypothetical protein [Kineococcus sp. SYSU DK006]|uniref:hypothetical protein n=1 Tax=Kineococcus sp. SYSU DK006 TaxID=3383127 RepID=UPI003D7E5554
MSMNEAGSHEAATTLKIGPVDAFDILLLHEALGRDLAEAMSSEPAEGDGRLGDPGALHVVLSLSPMVISAVAAFLLKPRRRERVTYTVTATYADGTTISEQYDIDRRESLSPPADVVNSLTALTRLPRPPMPAIENDEQSTENGNTDGGA